MKTKDRIRAFLAAESGTTGKSLALRLGISRQALNVHLQELIRQGLVVKEGVTRGARYRPPSATIPLPTWPRFRKEYALKGLQEDRVFDDITRRTALARHITPHAADIVRYVFTEMLNNAIDHSGSRVCRVNFELDDYSCAFQIRDFGIGLFASVSRKLNLPDEQSAIGEILKGKTTTMPARHTGEGIFFSSKAADSLAFRSHALTLLVDNQRKDVFISETRLLRGTEVSFRIRRKARRTLSAVFTEFAPERHDYRFEKTRVLVRLFQKDYISRSEARRLLAGLEKFKELDLDFSGVSTLGQGFAD